MEAVEDLEEEDINWEVEQVPYEEDTVSLNDPKYGFANQRSGVFKRLQVGSIFFTISVQSYLIHNDSLGIFPK